MGAIREVEIGAIHEVDISLIYIICPYARILWMLFAIKSSPSYTDKNFTRKPAYFLAVKKNGGPAEQSV